MGMKILPAEKTLCRSDLCEVSQEALNVALPFRFFGIDPVSILYTPLGNVAHGNRMNSRGYEQVVGGTHHKQ
jgi:hypothetical protein